MLFDFINLFGLAIILIMMIPNKICLLIYVITNLVLLAAYCLVWIFWFNKQCMFRTLCLAIFPSLIFILSGALSCSVLLLVSGVIFAPCHILISVKNLKYSQK